MKFLTKSRKSKATLNYIRFTGYCQQILFSYFHYSTELKQIKLAINKVNGYHQRFKY